MGADTLGFVSNQKAMVIEGQLERGQQSFSCNMSIFVVILVAEMPLLYPGLGILNF